MKTTFQIVGTYRLSHDTVGTWEAIIRGTWGDVVEKAREAFVVAIPFNDHLSIAITVKV